MVVDSHVHLLPPRLQARIREFLVAHAGAVFAYPTDHGEVVESLAIEGIAEVWSLPYARRPGVADGLNDAMASIARSSTSVSIVGGATVHKVRDGLDDLRRLALSAEAMTAITGGNARRLIDQIAT